MLKKEPFLLLLLTILATIPLFFGARHPLIQGIYSSLLLLGCGVWVLLHNEQVRAELINKKTVLAATFLGYIFVTALPLPSFLLRILSPIRADFLSNVENILQTARLNSLSYYAPETRFYAVYLTALLLYYLCATIIFRKEVHLTALLWVITGVGLFEAAYGLLQAMNPALGVLWLPSMVGAEGCARGTIIYRNQYAALLNMCWPMAMILAIQLYRKEAENSPPGSRQKRITLAQFFSLGLSKAMLPLLASAFMILAVVFSRSRGGIVVLVLTAALFLFLLPFSRRLKGLAGGIFLLFILTYGGMIGFRQVAERFLFFYESALGRMELWLDSLAILKDHLVTGIGMGTYQLVSPVYLRRVPSTSWYDFAHNEYVELAIELGLPMMLLLFGWLILGMGNHGLLVIREARQTSCLTDISNRSMVAIGTFCGLLGFLLHGFVDFVWRLPVNSFYAVTLLALLSAAAAPVPVDE